MPPNGFELSGRGSQYFVLLTRELLCNSLLELPAHPRSVPANGYAAITFPGIMNRDD